MKTVSSSATTVIKIGYYYHDLVMSNQHDGPHLVVRHDKILHTVPQLSNAGPTFTQYLNSDRKYNIPIGSIFLVNGHEAILREPLGPDNKVTLTASASMPEPKDRSCLLRHGRRLSVVDLPIVRESRPGLEIHEVLGSGREEVLAELNSYLDGLMVINNRLHRLEDRPLDFHLLLEIDRAGPGGIITVKLRQHEEDKLGVDQASQDAGNSRAIQVNLEGLDIGIKRLIRESELLPEHVRVVSWHELEKIGPAYHIHWPRTKSRAVNRIEP